MTPTRSLAASVVALGFAGTLTGTLPAAAAPAPCERAENYAAQSGAEVLRIDRLAVGPNASPPSPPAAGTRSAAPPPDPTAGSREDSDTLSEGIGIAGQALLGDILPGALTRSGPSTRSSSTSGTHRGDAAAGDLDSRRTDDDGATPPPAGGHGSTPPTAGGKDAGGAGGRGEAGPVLGEVGLGEARTALIGAARLNSAAVARILDGRADGKENWTEPIVQQAPPSHDRAATRATPPGRVGPLTVGGGEVSAHARWDAGMACGSAAGEATRAQASVRGASIVGGREWALVGIPEKVTGMSTTAVERHGGTARTVASATVTAGRIDLGGGKVRVRVLRPPTLVATMSAVEGGEVRYRPALIEVSGDGIATRRLETAGDHVDVAFGPQRHAMESADRRLGSGEVRPGVDLPLPQVPGLPPVAEPGVESAPAATTGTRLRISLGGVRQAARGHAIAARATAIKVTVTLGGATNGRGTSGYDGKQSSPTALDLAVGLLEAAAVAPEPATAGTSAGAAGGLPVTGPRVIGLAMAGATLILAGATAVCIGLIRRRPRP